MKYLLSLILAVTVNAQIPIAITVNWPNSQIVKAKYGTLPKAIFPGEVTGCNNGSEQVTFTQGGVIQAFKAQGFEAYSRTSAIAVIEAAQRGQFRSRWLRWSPVVIASLDALNGFVVTGVIRVGTTAAVAIAGSTAIAKDELGIVNGAIGQNPNLTYEADGMTALMQLNPGSCMVGTLMFATAGKRPVGGSTGPSFTINVVGRP